MKRLKKKWLIIALGISMALTIGCGSKEKEQNIKVMALKGPTAMGLVKLMEDAKIGSVNDNTYEFSVVASIDEVTPKLIQGEVDLAAVPANLAAVLYNNTDKDIKVLTVNTLGVLYLVETGQSVKSLEDLKGKKIYASGKGATPEYAISYILAQNGIDVDKDVTIEWKSEHAECVAAVAAEENAVAMLPQPFVTTAMVKNDKIRIAIDLNKEWDQLQDGAESKSSLITGVLVGRTEFIENHPEAVEKFMKSYEQSVSYVNKNTKEASILVEKFDIVPAQIAEKALAYCNIVFIDGQDMKEKLSGYLNVLMEINPKSVGGVVPSDDFYYAK